MPATLPRRVVAPVACVLVCALAPALARAQTAAPEAGEAAAATSSSEDNAPARSDAEAAPAEQAPAPTEQPPAAAEQAPAATTEGAPAAPTATPATAPTTPAESAPAAPAAPAPVAATPTAPPAETRPVPPAAPAPKPVTHDLAIETGWNNATGTGVRYLFVLPGTTWSVGAGIGTSLWGSRVSVGVRRADDVRQGAFFQFGIGIVSGTPAEELTFTSNGETVTGTFERTPGRTVDLAYGWRFPLGPGYLDASASWSINLAGTAIQQPGADGKLVKLDDDARAGLLLGAPGGLGFGAAYGFLF